MRTAAAALVVLAGSAGSAFAQCTSMWDTAIGNPGMGSGYASPVAAFDDGSGPEIYVGGSFGSAGGNAAAAYFARWDPATNTWSDVGGGIQPNNTTFITSITTADLGGGPKMYVGGAFGSAGNVAGTRSLAAYSNGAWSSTGAGWPLNTADSVWSLQPWNDGGGMKLYVGGGFTTVGGITGNGIAAYDGTNWTALGSGITGPFSPVVFAMEVFDDGTGEALYAAGRFGSAGGVAGTSMVARWDGEQWESLGGGLTSTHPAFSLEAMTVFNNELYVGGYAFNYPGQPTASVAKWDGSGWVAVGQNVTGRVTTLAAFDDGTGEALYLGGTMSTVSRVAKLVGNEWVALDGGADASVFGLNVVGDTMYAAGSFTTVGGNASSRVAARTSCGQACYANCDGSTTEPALNVADFSCFLQEFGQGSSYANCDGSTTEPVLNVADFSCFLQEFAAGCP